MPKRRKFTPEERQQSRQQKLEKRLKAGLDPESAEDLLDEMVRKSISEHGA